MRRLSILLVALAILLVGCKVDATVTVDVHDDGSGVVTLDVKLDAQAVSATEAGDAKLQDRVRIANLETAGWKIGSWQRADDGSASIRLSKAFTSPDQVAGIIGELSGDSGPLRDAQATRDRGLLSTSYDVTGAIDLAAIQTGIAADPDLVGALTNQQVDPAAIDGSLLQQIRDALTVKVVVNLPGSSTTVTGVSGQRVAIDASTSVRDTRRIVLILVAVVLLVVAVVVWFGGRHSRRRARARAPIPRFDPHSRPN
ncbi:MAG: hypothetical protein ABW033_01250 [Acidimicrobiia bacterium]